MSPSDHPPSPRGDSKAPPPSYSTLKFIVIFLGILLVLGSAVVIGTIISRLGNSEPPAAAAIGSAATAGPRIAKLLSEIELSLPEGSAISGHDLDGARLAIRLQGAAGVEIWIVDLTSGQVVSRVRLKTP